MSNKMWGGRFAEGPSAIMGEINASIGFDKRLFAQDIEGSKAHATMLAKQKTAYEIGVRLVGSEMCIRDRIGGHRCKTRTISQNMKAL